MAETRRPSPGLRARAGAGGDPRNFRGDRPCGRRRRRRRRDAPARGRMDALRRDRRLAGARPPRPRRARDHAARPIRAATTRASSSPTPRRSLFALEGVVHGGAELVELVWTPLDEALRLDLPQITRAVLDDLAAATQAGMDRARPRPFYRQRAVAAGAANCDVRRRRARRSAARACRRAPSTRRDRPARCAGCDQSAPWRFRRVRQATQASASSAQPTSSSKAASAATRSRRSSSKRAVSPAIGARHWRT